MNCSMFGEKYLLFHSGELESVEENAFREHIETCETCRRRYDSVIGVLKGVKDSLSAGELSGEARKRSLYVMEKAISEPAVAAHRPAWGAVMLMAAGIVLFATAAIAVFLTAPKLTPIESSVAAVPDETVEPAFLEEASKKSPFAAAAEYSE